ncbi:hypothetical protein ACLKA6_005687 [Drosophila palustris]
MNLQPRTPGGDVENEDAVFGGRRALARTPPPSAPPVTSGTGVFQFGANGKEAQPPQQPICDPLDLLRTLVALHALVLKNVDKLQSSTTCSSSTGTQTTPKPSNNGAKRQRESPHLPTRKSSPKRQRGSNQKQPSKQLDRPASFRDETTPSGTVSHDKTPTAKKQLQWQQVGPKAKKKKIPREPRPDAIIIQPQGDLSYSDILKLVTRRQDDKLKEVSVNVNRIRKTVKGELLLELNGASKDNTSKLKEEISEVLGLQSGIRTVTQETCLEIRDLDSLASKEDIAAAISAEIRTVVDVCSIKSLRPAYAGTQLAVVCLPPAQAKALLLEGKQTATDQPAVPGWKRFRVDSLNTERFSDLLSGLNTEGSAEHMANDVMDQLDSICNATMTQRKHYGRHHRPGVQDRSKEARLIQTSPAFGPCTDQSHRRGAISENGGS